MQCSECHHDPHEGVCSVCPCHAYTALSTESLAASGSNTEDAEGLATSIDTGLDAVIASLANVDTTTVDVVVQQFIGAVHGADAAIDQVLALLDVTNDDEPQVDVEPGATPLALAYAASGSLDQALAVTLPDGTPDAITATVPDIQTASDNCAQLITALTAAPAADDAQPNEEPDTPMPGMTAEGGEFADAPPATPPAAAPPPPQPPAAEPAQDGGTPFTMPIMVLEGVDTGDGRYINPEALTWRELPIPVMAITETGFGHEGAKLVGHITAVERVDVSAEVNPKTNEPYGTVDLDGVQVPVQGLKATGTFATVEDAQTVAELIRGQFLRGVSVDLSDVVSEIQLLDEEGTPQEDEELDLLDALFFEGDMREVVTEGRVMGATVCPFPAFEGAYITVDDVATPALQASVKPSQSKALRVLDMFGARECEPCDAGSGTPLVASAGPMAPPATWFEDPDLEQLTPLTITDDGHVYGHLAAWGSCHTGYSGRCVTPPKSKTDYAHFLTGAVLTAEGQLVACGQITMGTGHADLKLSPAATLAHYDNTGTAVADIAVGEDAFGIWFTGAMRPDVTELQVRQLRASPPSGDWRQIGRGLELLAALAVNVQGYPITRTRARVASGGTTALVAAGAGAMLRASLTHDAAIESLTRWQAEMKPFLDGVLEREARQLRDRELTTRTDRLRRRVHR